jgi:hypothetical protein
MITAKGPIVSDGEMEMEHFGDVGRKIQSQSHISYPVQSFRPLAILLLVNHRSLFLFA